MSFILDALRKSENERQRNQQPGIAHGQGPMARRGSGLWLPLVALLVGVNLSLVLVMWLMNDREQSPAAPAVTSPAPSTVNRELPRNPQPAGDTSRPVPAQTQTAAPAVASTPRNNPPAYDADSNLPTMEELVLSAAITLQPVKMDIHVYSDNPSERFVFINMTRYNEGEMLSEGPKLVAITPAGVVLRHQGYDFLVTREQ